MLSIVKELLLNNDLCVLCTCQDDMPDASLMLYICDDRCTKIHMLTLDDSRKYYNIIKNVHVSLLIDTRDKIRDKGTRINALTIRGEACIVKDKVAAEKIKDRLTQKHADLANLASNENVNVIEIAIQDILFLEDVDKAHLVNLSG
jgi:general stress protein 26